MTIRGTLSEAMAKHLLREISRDVWAEAKIDGSWVRLTIQSKPIGAYNLNVVAVLDNPEYAGQAFTVEECRLMHPSENELASGTGCQVPAGQTFAISFAFSLRGSEA